MKYPVLRFTFSGGHYAQQGQTEKALFEQLDVLEQAYEVPTIYDTASGRLKALIIQAEKRSGQPAVILIDEYDKPILDALQDKALARANRDFLRGFYGTIKDHDAHIRFTFLTGVSKFSQVSLFSGLNNLLDMTLDPNYSSLCGYTDHDTVFAAELKGLDREEIRDWYNGYNWLGEHVYNPYDVLNLFKRRSFQNYWFATGTPTFLVDLLFERHVPSLALDNMHSSSSMLSSFDVDDITTEALLFQTGYLTIKNQRRIGGQIYYTLGYPNQAVYQSLNELLLSTFTQNKSAQSDQSILLYDLLMNNDFDGLKTLFHAFFASIPHHWYTHNNIQSFEGFYASVFYSYFAALGLDASPGFTCYAFFIRSNIKYFTTFQCDYLTLKFFQFLFHSH